MEDEVGDPLRVEGAKRPLRHAAFENPSQEVDDTGFLVPTERAGDGFEAPRPRLSREYTKATVTEVFDVIIDVLVNHPGC